MTAAVLPAIRALVIAAARDRRTITYEELLDALDPEAVAEARDNLAAILRTISTESDEEGRGLLTAVVVQRSSGLPGNGWFRLAEELGRDVGDRGAAWTAELDRVHAAYANREIS